MRLVGYLFIFFLLHCLTSCSHVYDDSNLIIILREKIDSLVISNERIHITNSTSCRNIIQYGADPTGVVDSSKAFQAAIDDITYKSRICISSGKYRLKNRVDIRENTYIKMDDEALLIRDDNFNGNGSRSALFRSSSHNHKINNVTIEGGKITVSFNGIRSGGRILDWYGDNWTVKGVKILTYGNNTSHSRAISYVGNNTLIENVEISGPGCGIGCGGIIIGGGKNHLIRNNKVFSGDDSIAIFPGALIEGRNEKLLNNDISNVYINNNYVISNSARVFGAGLHCLSTFDCNTFTADIKNVSVKNLYGISIKNKENSMVLLVYNSSRNGQVKAISLKNIEIASEGVIRHGYKIIGNEFSPVGEILLDDISFFGDCLESKVFLNNVSIFDSTNVVKNMIGTC
ncbi:hypothetical protein J3369_01905 [Alteromonas sp. NFXS44]|uniref:glycosyl hydrolase family 28-related protein n=1 Tax=Alteromonas sp. NFXS44 TaxID=2818435 RepID=UPI0032DF0541